MRLLTQSIIMIIITLKLNCKCLRRDVGSYWNVRRSAEGALRKFFLIHTKGWDQFAVSFLCVCVCETNTDCIKVLAAFNHLGTHNLPTVRPLFVSQGLTYWPVKSKKGTCVLSCYSHRASHTAGDRQCLAQGHFSSCCPFVSCKWPVGLI